MEQYLDSKGKVHYLDDNGKEIKGNVSLLNQVANNLKAMGTNFNSWINETNPESAAYKQKVNTALALTTLPMGAGAKATQAIAKPLVPYVGKQIAKNVAQGVGAGAVSGGVEGVGRGLIEGENPILTGVTDALLGASFGGLGGFGANKIAQTQWIKDLVKHLNTPKKYWTYNKNNVNEALRDKNWQNSLDKFTKDAFYHYTDDGYQNINNTLRSENPPFVPSVELEIDALNKAINNYNLQEPMTVYRAVDTDKLAEILGSNNPKNFINKELPEPAFGSTSAVKSAVYGTPDHSILEINIPNGEGIGAYINDLSKFKNQEYEFLLNKGNNFKINNAFNDNGNFYIEADWLPKGQ